MLEYKKRVRLIAARYGLATEYLPGNGVRVRSSDTSIEFLPTSKNGMTCAVIALSGSFHFQAQKRFVFDIIRKFSSGRSLVDYAPKGLPLTIQEYVEEERATSTIANLRKRIVDGTVENGELGGNHYNVEYYNGILILFDIFTDAPANVIDTTKDF